MNQEKFYSEVEVRDDWSFSELSRSQTREVSHCYHSYPSKFIPQLARALIEEYTDEGDCIWDPFCGSGTLNTEAYRTGRPSIGTDINPVACLISKTKITPLDPDILNNIITNLLENLNHYKIWDQKYYNNKNLLNGNEELLKDWFTDDNLLELCHILWHIKKQNNTAKYRNFELCVLSSVLKTSSWWLNSSVKVQKDPNKKPENPLSYFKRQLLLMEKANQRFYNENEDNDTPVRILNHNAKHKLPGKQLFDYIITSPPYLVSYDYSDIFKLSTYFLFYQPEYSSFRKRFIGTPLYKVNNRHFNYSEPDKAVIHQINDTGIRRKLTEYYKDMSLFLKKTQSHIKKNGQLLLIIGDTELRKVKIPNAHLLTEIAEEIGLSLLKAFVREVPVKILPTVRDKETGQFTSRKNNDSAERYSHEYILQFNRGS